MDNYSKTKSQSVLKLSTKLSLDSVSDSSKYGISTARYKYDEYSRNVNIGFDTVIYDQNGDVKFIGDRELFYDDNHHLIKSGEHSYAYDDNGNLTLEAYADTTDDVLYRINYFYDINNIMTRQEYWGANLSTGYEYFKQYTEYNTYDSNNNIILCMVYYFTGTDSSQVGRLEFSYDVNNNLLQYLYYDLSGSETTLLSKVLQSFGENDEMLWREFYSLDNISNSLELYRKITFDYDVNYSLSQLLLPVDYNSSIWSIGSMKMDKYMLGESIDIGYDGDTVWYSSTKKYYYSEKTVGLDNIIEDIDGLKLYPNPTKDIVNIESTENIDKVEIYNILGRKIMEENINAFNSDINISSLPKDIYFLKIFSAKKVNTRKIVKN